MLANAWCGLWDVTEVYRWFFGFAFFCAGAFVYLFRRQGGRGLALVILGCLIAILPVPITFLAHDTFGITLPSCSPPDG
ncbi:MAG: hypothetical protein ACPGNV_18410 [Mangrovicoccus sp.]